jgi:LysM repeat protein
MKKRYFNLIMASVILMLMLSGCLKSAAETEVEATATSAINFPVTTQQPSMKDILSGTQTAMAMKSVPTATVPLASATVPPAATETQVPTETVSVPTATPGRPATWTLKQGEWAICIARRYDLNLETFFSANGLTMESRPAVGTVLNIPATGNWSEEFGSKALVAHPVTYTVAAGDTLYSIACHFGDVDPNDIIAKNGLEDPYPLTAGTKLEIP